MLMLEGIWEHTLESNHINAIVAAKAFTYKIVFYFLWGQILEADLICAITMASHLNAAVFLHSIWKHTLERNLINVIIVTWLSLIHVLGNLKRLKSSCKYRPCSQALLFFKWSYSLFAIFCLNKFLPDILVSLKNLWH